jgi:hypothetical protein
VPVLITAKFVLARAAGSSGAPDSRAGRDPCLGALASDADLERREEAEPERRSDDDLLEHVILLAVCGRPHRNEWATEGALKKARKCLETLVFWQELAGRWDRCRFGSVWGPGDHRRKTQGALSGRLPLALIGVIAYLIGRREGVRPQLIRPARPRKRPPGRSRPVSKPLQH